MLAVATPTGARPWPAPGLNVALVLVLLGPAGGCRREERVPGVDAGEVASPEAGGRTAPTRPRLVVAVVLDQLATWVLERHLPLLPEDGLLRRALRDGVYLPRVRYPYGATVTAAGHATLFTGRLPRDHGVVANERHDAGRGRKRAIVDDGEHAVHGTTGFASPSVLRVPTVADALKSATGGRARVASISMKDRSAILPAGRSPDLVAFYETAVPGFTTSAFYADRLPAWLEAFNAAHPIAGYLGIWEPLEVTRAAAGVADDRAVEGSGRGLGRTFPHDPRAAARPEALLPFLPSSTRLQLELAREAVGALGLGADDVPDLLALSVSATDYIGHVYGAESWEYLDNLIRTDRLLAELYVELAARVAVAFVVTSDHGQAPLPDDPAPPRIDPEALLEALDAALSARFGPGPFVAGYHLPYLYLSEAARERPDRDALVAALLELLRARPDIALAERSEVAARWTDADGPLRAAVAAGIDVEGSGPVYVVPAEGVIVDPGLGGGGTTHGTPYLYDREVPVLALGAGVPRLRSEAPQDILQVAASLAALLGIPPPHGATAPPLPGFGPIAPASAAPAAGR